MFVNLVYIVHASVKPLLKKRTLEWKWKDVSVAMSANVSKGLGDFFSYTHALESLRQLRVRKCLASSAIYLTEEWRFCLRQSWSLIRRSLTFAKVESFNQCSRLLPVSIIAFERMQ